MKTLPIVDLAGSEAAIAASIRAACEDVGFFYVVNHGLPEAAQRELESLSRQFFAQPFEEKMAIRMKLGGRAWRGYFPVGDELTSGQPDLKEGLYFGSELPPDHPRVLARVPMHGANVFPALPGFRAAVLGHIAAMTALGHRLMRGIARSLELEAAYFHDRYTADPLVLFRIFNYPPASARPAAAWGVGEHTDYGLLTILQQDASGGLELRSRRGWLSAPPIADAFVCNIGDMLDRMTGGRYRSTPHRVRNTASVDRLSFPFFFDPDFDARVRPISSPLFDDREERWDRASVHAFEGTYGDYILAKVSKVFPQLDREVEA